MSISIKDLELKIIHRIEQKEKNGVKEHKLKSWFNDADRDNDGDITLQEFQVVLRDHCGNALTTQESAFLFEFWDTMAGQRDPSGRVEVALLVADLMASMPTYGTGFNSGNETIKANKGARGNLPSQSGGIFGGGSYEADARNELPPRAPPQPSGGYQMASNNNNPVRPRGNQPSQPGGVFAPYEEPQSNRAQGGGNKSNQSSIAGGIFGEAPSVEAPKKHGRNSNQSSIPGGIFG